MKCLLNILAWRGIAALLFLVALSVSLARADNPPAQPLQPPHDKAALIRLNAPVDNIMLDSLNRRIDLARKAGCTLIVLDIDSYGGLVTSALAIDKLIKRLPTEHLATVAWVHDKAYSAGAFMALSCQQIVMSRQSALGDCAPIAVNTWLGNVNAMPATERAKAVSPILEDLDESAAQNGYDKMLLRSMVVTDIEIHQVRNSTTGESRYVDTAAKDKLLAEENLGPGGVKDHPWRFVETVKSNAQLLTVSNEEAFKMGLSKATIDNEQDLRAALNIRGDLLTLNFSWLEIATAWLTQPAVRFMLFVAMLVFAWIEFSHPGVTVPGVCAILCLTLLVGAPYLTGLAQAWEILLVVLGLAVIVADLFLFGGIGLFAVPGFLLMAIGLVASFVPAQPGGGWPSLPGTWAAVQTGLAVVLFGSLSAFVAFFLLAKYLYITPGFRRFQLAPTGVTTNAVPRDAADRPATEAVFIGAVGKAETDLRPAGKARFDDHLLNVVSFGSFIAQETEVEVTHIQGNKIIVRPRVAFEGESA
jgi:membrane-bound serine protease (ClpP class)